MESPGNPHISIAWEIPEGSDDALEVAVYYDVDAAFGGKGTIRSLDSDAGSLRGLPFVEITRGFPDDPGAPGAIVNFALRRLCQRGRRNLVYLRVQDGQDWSILRPSVTVTELSGLSVQHPIQPRIRTLPVCAVALIDWTEDGPQIWTCLKYEETPEAMISRLDRTRL